jgi:hypothetical protein
VEFNSIPLDPNKNVGQQINEVLSNYYANWLDTPIPGLDNKTPRESSKTEEGRKKLEFLFDYMKKLPSSVPFPYEAVKKELGL